MSNVDLVTTQRVDQIKVFNLFCFFGGDMMRTASAAQVDLRIVQALAHDFAWLDKIKGRNRLDTPDGLQLEQENNRAANYHVAKQMMEMISNIVQTIEENPEKWAEHNLLNTVTKADGDVTTFSPKPLLEIAKAVQTVQDMTYRALGDKIAARAETTGAASGEVTNLAINIYAGLEKLSKASKQIDREVVDITTAAIETVGADQGVDTTAR